MQDRMNDRPATPYKQPSHRVGPLPVHVARQAPAEGKPSEAAGCKCRAHDQCTQGYYSTMSPKRCQYMIEICERHARICFDVTRNRICGGVIDAESEKRQGCPRSDDHQFKLAPGLLAHHHQRTLASRARQRWAVSLYRAAPRIAYSAPPETARAVHERKIVA